MPGQNQGLLLSYVTPVVDGSIIKLSTNLSTRASTYSPNAKNVIMMQLENHMAGLLDTGAEIAIEIKSQEDEGSIDAQEAMKNRDHVKKNWMLGPEKTQQPNSDYWRKIATVWRISPDQARRNLCANCEYFNDSPDMLAQMESVPEDAYDKDGGGRGWCMKFDFICHNLRTCQAWERGQQPEDESKGYENGED